MDYFVIGQDGKEYGPANVDTLRQWAEQSRLLPQTMLKGAQSATPVPASSVPGIFPPVTPAAPPPVTGVPTGNWSQPPSPYPRQPVMPVKHSYADLIGIVFRCVLGLVFFFVYQGLGLVVSGYAVIYAIQMKAKGHPHGLIAILIASVTFAVILIGWFFRLGGTKI